MPTNTTSNTANSQEARLQRLFEQDQKAQQASKDNLKAKYGKSPSNPKGLTDEEIATVQRDESLKIPKFQITYACRSCGKMITRYTSDIFVAGQPGAVRDCTECLKTNKGTRSEETKDLRKLMAAARKAGLPIMVEGKVNPEVLALTAE